MIPHRLTCTVEFSKSIKKKRFKSWRCAKKKKSDTLKLFLFWPIRDVIHSAGVLPSAVDGKHLPWHHRPGRCPEESSRLQCSSFVPYVIHPFQAVDSTLFGFKSTFTVFLIKWRIAVPSQLYWPCSISLSPDCLIKKCIFWSHRGLACLAATLSYGE